MEITTNVRKSQLQVVLVGRPNVGKSRLFNRLCGRRVSIVHDQIGVTRDIIPEEILPGVVLMDTGGIGLSSANDDPLLSAIEEQIDFAIAAADLIFFIVDASVGCLPLDFEMAQKLRRSGKPIRLLANKVDLECHRLHLDSFYALGLGTALAVSAEHGRGEEDIHREIQALAKQQLSSVPDDSRKEKCISICFAGRPNMGKSSLVNALLREKKTIVSPIPGTTRDATSYRLSFQHSDGTMWNFCLIDTAGVKAKKKIGSPVEYFSQLRTEKAMEQSDIVFLVIDALSGVLKQDKQLATQILRAGKGLIVVVNKWDLAEQSFHESKLEDYKTLEDFQENFLQAIRKEILSIPGSPVLFTSAQTTDPLKELLAAAHALYGRMTQSIGTGPLNRVLQKLMEDHPPAATVGHRFKVYYATQVGNFPLKFKIFCNQKERLAEPYQRYLENGLRKHFPLDGCPVGFEWISKEKRYASTYAKV
ncbi:MAG: ribosome biogenesis GTPase Der [Puniceicoccales bacterium]|jgi:GTP-binding protein|nr:ribosome biogenesis GTPase Der [Puniceicoccales bacterium]